MAGQKSNINAQIVSNKYVQEYLMENLGEESVKIVKAASEEITDDALAEKCKLKVSAIRAVLNKLHNMRLAEYTRIKDKDTGWYSYFWRVNMNGMFEILQEEMKGEIERTEEEIEERTTILSYFCKKCSKENVIDFEIATRLCFKCPNCKKSLHQVKRNREQVQDKLDSLKKKQQKFCELLEKKKNEPVKKKSEPIKKKVEPVKKKVVSKKKAVPKKKAPSKKKKN